MTWRDDVTKLNADPVVRAACAEMGNWNAEWQRRRVT